MFVKRKLKNFFSFYSFLYPFLFSFFSFPSWSLQGQTLKLTPPVYTLPAVVVEGEFPETPSPGMESLAPTKPPIPQPFSLEAGQGAESVRATVNSFGLELTTMERDQDISTWRRNRPWLLELPPLLRPANPWEPSWQQALRISYFKEKGITGKLRGRTQDFHWQGEVGLKSYHQKVSYWENEHTLYNYSDDTLKTYTPHQQDNFLSLQVKRKDTYFILERDDHKKDVLFLKKVQGHNKKDQWEMDVHQEYEQWKLTLYSFIRKDQFTSITPYIPSTQSKNNKTGISITKDFFFNLSLNTFFFQENLKRNFSNSRVDQKFTRSHLELRTESKQEFPPWIDAQFYAFYNTVQDQGQSSKSYHTWNLGQSLSTDHHHLTGLSLKVIKYEKIPLPTHVFGDGGLLEESPNLPLEKGIRAQFGPWVKWNQFNFSGYGFIEEVKNLPLQMKVGPASAQTFPVGGVWVRGLEALSTFELDLFSVNLKYSYQLALNNSAINSQRGKRIPGRPAHSFKASVIYPFTNSLTAGPDFQYASQDYLNMDNTWVAPPQSKIGFFLQYKKSSWAIRLEGFNLFPKSEKSPPYYSFQGRQAPNLLEPLQEEREFLLNGEVLL